MNINKLIASTIAAALILMAPGQGAYAAIAARANAGSAGLPGAIPGGAFSLGSQSTQLGLPNNGLSLSAAPSALVTAPQIAVQPTLNAAVSATAQPSAAETVSGVKASAVAVAPSASAAPVRSADKVQVQPTDAPAEAVGARETLTEAAGQLQGRGAAPSLGEQAEISGRLFEGKQKTLLVVGSLPKRPFIKEEAVATAAKLGVRLVLVDKPENREHTADSVADENYIPAPIDDHSDETTQSIIDKAQAWAAEKGITIDAVYTSLNPYAVLAGRLADAFKARGNSGDAVSAAHSKSAAREAFAQDASIATAYRVVTSAEEAKKAYTEMGGGKFVMKPIKGAGSQGVVTDVASAEAAEAVFTRINTALEEFTKRADAGFYQLEKNPGIMMERQLEGPEVDVELVMKDGKAAFHVVSDNPPMDKPLTVEKGVTFESELVDEIKDALVAGAVKAANLLKLDNGNLHIEMMMTPEGPRILEVNARMGGAFVWEFVKKTTGVNLIEQGIRAVLGLEVEGGKAGGEVLEARFFIPKASGKIVAIEGLEEAMAEAGYDNLKLSKKVGDSIKAPEEDTFDYIGYASYKGKTYDEAMGRFLKAAEKVTIKIETATGEIVTQTAAHSHKAEPVEAQLTAAGMTKWGEPMAQAMARRDKMLKGYLYGQLALIASFALYYSLFSPLAKALVGSSGVGAGRSGYAGALAIFSPIAGILAEKFSTRSILIGAFAARAVIWAVVLPLAWLALGGGAPFLAAFVALMFLDGAVVSINALVDIDAGGLDFLAQQYHFPMDDATRNKYNAVLDGFYSASRVVMAPLMAGLGIVAAGFLSSAAAALVVIMAVSFALPAVVGIGFYLKALPKNADVPKVDESLGMGQRFKKVGGELKDGLKLAVVKPLVRWRLLFYSLERAVEDSMLFVVLAEFAMQILAPGNAAWGAFAAAVLIAVGKIGSMITAWFMHKNWEAPKTAGERWRAYRLFFPLALLGTMSTGLLPLAASMAHSGWFWAAAAVAGLSSFLFNLFFEAAHLGFRNLMQAIFAEEGASGRLFSIANLVVMGVNALAIIGFSLIFANFGIWTALVIAASIYSAIGLIEYFIAPRLMFTPEERNAR